MSESFDELAIAQAARMAALDATMMALIKTHPDKAAFLQALEGMSEKAYQLLSAALPERLTRGAEFAQQNFDSFLSRMMVTAKTP
jgi:hypothetical protein